jgi:N-acetylglutamate synthase
MPVSPPPPTDATPARRQPAVASVSGLVDAVGRRVSVRRHVPGGLSDVVGDLLEADPTRLLVRRRDGTEVEVAAADFVSGRVIPAPVPRLRTAAEVTDLTLERVAAHGWRPLEEERLGQWRLRASGGFTGRANSVLPLGDPSRPLEQALADVRRWYSRRDLVPLIQVPLPLLADLDADLAAAGWEATNAVDVMVADVAGVDYQLLAASTDLSSAASTVSAAPDDMWLSLYHYRGHPLPPSAAGVLVNCDQPLFVTVRDTSGRPVGVGRGAVTGPWVGVTAVTVDPSTRRQGVGTRVMRVLLDAAASRGARFVYLQVAQENAAALAMYHRLGFVVHHRYHYRRWP